MFNRIATYGCYCLLSIVYCLLSNCALIVIPGGGDKDLLPPRVVKYSPDSAAVNFSSKEISLTFDEYIQVADLQKQLAISPPMVQAPEIKVKGKTLSIELKDTLKKNATYSIDFGDAIHDIKENNAKKNFRYVFSTGGKIDTLSISGTVKNAFDFKPEKGVLVMLYDSYDDSIPCKKLPSYYAKTRDDGSYTITNIRSGTYKAFALKEVNANYLYDVPTESIAFCDTLVKIEKHSKLDLLMFKEAPKVQRLLKSYVKGYGNMILAYARPIEELSFRPLNAGTKTETFLTEFNPGRDTARVWFPVFSKDSLHFQAMADGITIDTIKIGTSQFKKDGGGRGEAFKLIATSNVKKDNLFDLHTGIRISFNHPLNENSINTDNATKIKLIEDTVFIPWQLRGNTYRRLFEIIKPDSSTTAGVSMSKWKENSRIQIFIPPATFTDIFGLTNDTIKLDFKTQEEKYYGTFKLNLKMKFRIAFILQLMNEKGEVFNYSSSDKSIFTYTFLPPGAYKLRIIYDKNGDGKWSPGNYFAKKKPETVFYYPGAITIRSNWDLELEWKVE